AELLLRIRQAISDDLQRANLLRVRGRHLDREFEDATRAFDALDAALGTAAAGAPSDEEWRRARDLLDILLYRRQSVEQQLRVLEQKRATYEEAAEFVSTGEFHEPDPARGEATGTAGPEAADASPAEAAPALPGLPATQPGAAAAPAPAGPAEPPVYDRRVAEAERDLERAQAALRRAELSLRMVEELVSLNQDERALVESAVLLGRRHAELLQAMARAAGAQAGESAAKATATPAQAGGIRATPEAGAPPAVADARSAGLELRAARAQQAVRRDQQ